MKKEEWAKLIDFTYLYREPINRESVLEFLDAALKNHLRSVCSYLYFFRSCLMHPILVKRLAEARKKGILLVAVVDFPNGNGGLERKKKEAKLAKALRIDEVDVVMNVEAFKQSQYQLVDDEIKAVTDIFGRNTKVIIESGVLENWQLSMACDIINSAKAGFVKTSTGFNFNISFDEKLEHVKTLKGIIEKERYDLKIKMSGGLETLEQLERARKVGADIFGISWQKAVKILDEIHNYSKQEEVVREENEAMIEFLNKKVP